MKHFIGICDHILADSVGEPGKRTFKIYAKSNDGLLIVWMEKESLFQIGISLAQFIANNSEPVSKSQFNPNVEINSKDLEFRTEDISLSHEPDSDIFTVFSSGYIKDDQFVDSSFSFSRELAEQLSKQILKVVSSGRKPCFLCGIPLNPESAHICVKLNGYSVKSDSNI